MFQIWLPSPIYYQSTQLLTPGQEAILEAYCIFLAHNLTPPNAIRVRFLAGEILGTTESPPGPAWLHAFVVLGTSQIKSN